MSKNSGILGGTHHNMGAGSLGPDHYYHFLFLLPLDLEASKTCKNTKIFFYLCALPLSKSQADFLYKNSRENW